MTLLLNTANVDFINLINNFVNEIKTEFNEIAAIAA